MSISYYDFNNLSKESQLELVMAAGKLISETYKNDLKVVLYEVSFFSVEIVYNTINGKVASFSAFQNKTIK